MWVLLIRSITEKLMVFIETLERCLSKSLSREVVYEKIFEPLKLGDVPYASTDLLKEAVGFKPETIGGTRYLTYVKNVEI